MDALDIKSPTHMSTQQYSLDWTEKRPPEVQAAIQDGMAKADANADPKWRHIFDACVLAAAKKKPEITSDDVLTEIEALPSHPETHNLSAIGPAMNRAWKMGVIHPTTRTVRSKRAGKNGNLHVIWKSNYFGGNP